MLVCLLWGIFAGPAEAHDFWLEPSSYEVEAEEPVTFSLREGHGAGNPLPRNEGRIVRFELLGPEGALPIRGADRMQPAGAVRKLPPGAYAAVYANTPARSELPGPRFESYLEEKGLQDAARQRREEGTTGEPGKERFYRCAKTLLTVGDGGDESSHATASTPAGLTLELVPAKAPSELAPGETLSVELLFRGQPLPGAKVTAFGGQATHGSPSGEPLTLTTDAGGRISLPLEGGRWRLQAVHMEALNGEALNGEAPEGSEDHESDRGKAPSASDLDWQSWWASLTFAVPETPRRAAR